MATEYRAISFLQVKRDCLIDYFDPEPWLCRRVVKEIRCVEKNCPRWKRLKKARVK